LGMMCSSGQSMAIDMVAAHKWFNLAALRGFRDAVRLRTMMFSYSFPISLLPRGGPSARAPTGSRPAFLS
jgi:hypothetical protein